MTAAAARQRFDQLALALQGAAILEDWPKVAALHDTFQSELKALFNADQPADPDQTYDLLVDLQRLAEDLSDRVAQARQHCAEQLDPIQKTQRGLRQYASLAPEPIG